MLYPHYFSLFAIIGAYFKVILPDLGIRS